MCCLLWCMTALTHAQTVREDVRVDIRRSAGFQTPYPNRSAEPLTPSPAGKKPFYISHYGCHGSRYNTTPESYDTPYNIMAKADSLNKLTPLGRDVLRRIKLIRQDAYLRWGEITELGAQQLADISTRMLKHFPEVFSEDCNISGRSTTLTRCIMSMENAMLPFARRYSIIHHDATRRDTYYLNYVDKNLLAEQMDSLTRQRFNEFAARCEHPAPLMERLFNDTAYVGQEVDAAQLYTAIFRLAGNLQNLELRRELTLYDLFTPDEAYSNWRKANAWSYINYGGCTLNGGRQPYSQRILLRRMIEMADSCISVPTPTVQLRFGDETGIIPLVCLLDMNGYAMATDDLDSLDQKGWADFRISPMSANIQLIFYRANPQDDDVLLKVLLNEREATLPLPADHAPYYRWQDFRKYYLKKIDDYVQNEE